MYFAGFECFWGFFLADWGSFEQPIDIFWIYDDILIYLGLNLRIYDTVLLKIKSTGTHICR